MFHVTVTYLLLRSICGTENLSADVLTAVFVNNQHGIQQRRQDFDKKLQGCTTQRLTDEFPERSWTKRDVNKLLKKLRDTGTSARPGSSDLAVPPTFYRRK